MSNKYLKVKDGEGLVRDADSMAILNTDNMALMAYKARKQKEAMINRIIEENSELKKEVSEIKALLEKLVGQGK